MMVSNCSAGEDSWESPGQQDQPWVVIEWTDTEAEAPILWPPDAKSWLTGKDPNDGKDWRQKEKRAAEDEMLDSITNSMDMNLSKLWQTVEDRGA